MAIRLNVQAKLDGAKEVANYVVRRHDADNLDDSFLFKKERDLAYFKRFNQGNKYCKPEDLKEVEDYILKNLSKLRLTPEKLCEAIYMTDGNYWKSGILSYDSFMHSYAYLLHKKPGQLTRRDKFEGLMRATWDRDIMGEFQKALNTEEYFFYAYGLYKKLGGEKEYMIYTKDRTYPTAPIYTLADRETIDTDVCIKHGTLVMDVPRFLDRLVIMNALSNHEVFIVLDEEKDESNILFGRHEIYKFLCEEKGVGLKNFRYIWMKMARETGIANKKGKRFVVGEAYIHRINFQSYYFIGYSDDGELLFSPYRSPDYGILFYADDMFDEVEYRIYNLEKNVKLLQKDVEDIHTRIDRLDDRISYIFSSYMNGNLEKYKRKVIQMKQAMSADLDAKLDKIQQTQDNIAIQQASSSVPDNYKFSHFEGDKVVFKDVIGTYMFEEISGGNTKSVSRK